MFLRAALVPSLCAVLCLAVQAQSGPTVPPGTREYAAGTTSVRRWTEAGKERAAWSRSGGPWQPLLSPDDRLHFLLQTFDPLQGLPQFPAPLGVPPQTRLRIVQFHTQVLEAYRDEVQLSAEILHFMPANALFVRCSAQAVLQLRALPCVRWVGDLPNALKLDAALRAFVSAGGNAATDVNLVLARKTDRPAVLAEIAQLQGQVTDPCPGSVMVRAQLTPAQLLALLASDTVTWADLAGPDGFDMDNARIQGGANVVEMLAGYRGQGVRVEVTEGFDETHADLAGRVLVRGSNFSFQHGHCTAGIVGGSGAGNAAARGMLPESLLIEGAYGSSNHYAQIQASVDPAQPWQTMVATASWGAAVTTDYNAISQAMDDALFDSGLTRLNSQSNNGSQVSRPEAWAKNIISVGGVKHLDDALPGNDRWNQPGDFSAASIGPATDGRLKPDIVGYYDNVLTIDLPGPLGYTPGDYNPAFDGTSAATPIVAGHVGILQQMFTDGLFGNPLPLPATAANRFANRPRMTTSKALLCNTATQYPFAGLAHDLARTHQGWGFPSLDRLHDNRRKIVVLDEYDRLELGQSREYWVQIAPGTAEFRVTMVYADPAAQANAAIHLVNDANLQVTRDADGVSWWGNHGLADGTASVPGGAPNDRDTIECVYLASPVPGTYRIRVEAASIVEDGKVETPATDLDFALAFHPVGGGYRDDSGLQLDLVSTGPGDLRFQCGNLPAGGWTEGFTALSLTTARGPGFGNFFGLEIDSLTGALWSLPAAADNPFHFPNLGSSGYPFVPYTMPSWVVSLLAGFHLDAVLVLWNGNEITAVSNVDRILLQ